MSHDNETESLLTSELRKLAPSLPEDQRFWDDMKRNVRVGVSKAKESNVRRLRFFSGAVLAVTFAAVAFLWATKEESPATVAPSLALSPLPFDAAVATRESPPRWATTGDELQEEEILDWSETDDWEVEMEMEDLSNEELSLLYAALAEGV